MPLPIDTSFSLDRETNTAIRFGSRDRANRAKAQAVIRRIDKRLADPKTTASEMKRLIRSRAEWVAYLDGLQEAPKQAAE